MFAMSDSISIILPMLVMGFFSKLFIMNNYELFVENKEQSYTFATHDNIL
jgi:hypothetical protein